MRPAVVIKTDPIADYSAGVLQCVKPLPMDALLFQGSDHPLHHAVLLRTMRRDELLFKPIASDQGCEASAGKDQPVIGSKQKRSGHFAQGTVSSDQGLLKSSLSGLGLTRSRQMPA